MRDKDDLDLLIDAALDSYANPAADVRLEDRMLQGLRKHTANLSAPRHPRWLAWSAALATAACLIALAFFISRPAIRPVNTAHTQQKPQDTKAVAARNPTPATSQGTSPHPAKSLRIRTDPPVSTETAKADPLPRLDVFPTAAPLDEQVEALAFFVRKAPPNEVKELLAKQARADAPLAFDELQIPPLSPLDEGGK